MSTEISINNPVLDNTNQQEVLQRFDNLIDDICAICEKNEINQIIAKLKPLIRYKGHFLSLVDNVVENSSYHYGQSNHENIDALLNRMLREFTLTEQLYLIANMETFGVSHNDKMIRLLKYFMRKLVKQRILNKIDITI